MTVSSLSAYHLRVRMRATESIQFQDHIGASLRGAFFDALWGRFCVRKDVLACANCPLVQSCPVSSLVAPLRDERPGMREIARPFAIRPPIDHASTLQLGDTLTFGLVIFGRRLDLFPYVTMALRRMGREGIGRRVKDNHWQRGHFVIDNVQVVNPLSGEEQPLQDPGSSWWLFPELATTWSDAQTKAAELQGDRITLGLVTPLRLKDEGEYVRRLELRPFVKRLLERHDSLAREYGGTPFDKEERLSLIAQAGTVKLLRDETHWVKLRSYSHRQQRGMPISGLMGKVAYGGEIQPLLPLLVWGTVIQVGKSVTKGNGVYEIAEGACAP